MNTLDMFNKLMKYPQNKELGAMIIEIVKELETLGWKPNPKKMYEEMAAINVLATIKWGMKKGRIPQGANDNEDEEVEKQPIGFMDFKKAA